MFVPHPYQQEAIDYLYCRLAIDNQKGGSLQLDPGLGKTSICLRLIEMLRPKRTLVVAPLRVIYNVWPNEIEKWGFPLTVSIVHGTESKRRRALQRPADLYLINREGIPWLARLKGEHRPPPFDLLLNDESTSFKSWSAMRTKALRSLLPSIRWRVNLTGTPAPNGEQDWFAQQFIADDGDALGKTLTYFRANYMVPDPFSFNGHGYRMDDSARKRFYARIQDSVLCMKCEDHLDMPPRVFHTLWVDLPPDVRRAYESLEKQLFGLLDSGQRLEASSAGAKYLTLRQIANGGAYQTDDGGDRTDVFVHSAKIDALRELVGELAGKPLLVAYQFNHDADRLQKAFPGAPAIRGGMSAKASGKIIGDWNEGRLPLLFVQPLAMSHGVNLQAGGRDLAWFGLTDNLESFLQLNARLWRQGQTGQVRYHLIQARDTVDEAVKLKLNHKSRAQDAMVDALVEYRRSKKAKETSHV